ncbi:MAG: phosphatase PAP2 family protein [Candidatus Thermoplasmatota archaeon]|nr:phosphatase PAP2 family protein [Candidatus Thermoplasmatota archaeon]MEC8625496.1 phosphatase PAP2 family protein [Candidatus Thermoplasmatota archaeon]MEE2666484.1 phosphatase PAP2 family protein [Candidatus Thermoplasmatota archaeon]
MEGVYLTWMISALALGVVLLPVYAPPWSRLTLSGFVDFIRRYWVHVLLLFMIYNAKDFLDQVDRILMANTNLDMTAWIYAIEGDLVLRIQEAFEARWLSIALTHFYVAGFMFICYVSVFYVAYFDDRWMADRIVLSIAWVYILAVPFYLFFNVRVTGDVIPGMETIAYDLTPEIADWFRRIDPFTNGMPSLHIGIPFVVWLCLLRYDEDRRWNRYRHTVLLYTVVTAFTILYLGIHWISDIVGGLLIAAGAVAMTERTVGFVWRIGDERTMNARLASLLTQPRVALNALIAPVTTQLKRFRTPGARESRLGLGVVLFLVLLVVTYDLTHQALPAGGIEAPEGAAAADGWVATMDNRSGVHTVVLNDLSTPDVVIEVAQPNMTEGDLVALDGRHVVMANASVIRSVRTDAPQTITMETTIDDKPSILTLADGPQGTVVLAVINGTLHGWTMLGEDAMLPAQASGVIALVTNGAELAWATEDRPLDVRMARLGTSGALTVPLNASATPEQEAEMLGWGLPADVDNGTIIDLELSQTHLVAVVNVSTVDRLVLYERALGTMHLIGDGKYSAADPALGVDVLAYTGWDHLNPINPETKYLDSEIHLHDLSTNLTEVLTADTRDQWSPTVLEEHIIFLERSASDETSVRIYSREVVLQPYSNAVLQVGLMVMLALTFAYVVQIQQEARGRRTEEE